LLILSFIVSSSVSLSAEETLLTAVAREGSVIVSATLSGVESGQIYSTFRKGLLEEGLKAEISYQFRLYRRDNGVFSFMGDKLITEKKIIKRAYLDIYERAFVIEVNEEKKALLYEEEFLEEFFKAEDVQIGRLSSRESKEYYVLARISFSPVRLVPPLNIISLLYKKTAVATRWTEAEIKVLTPKEQGF